MENNNTRGTILQLRDSSTNHEGNSSKYKQNVRVNMGGDVPNWKPSFTAECCMAASRIADRMSSFRVWAHSGPCSQTAIRLHLEWSTGCSTTQHATVRVRHISHCSTTHNCRSETHTNCSKIHSHRNTTHKPLQHNIYSSQHIDDQGVRQHTDDQRVGSHLECSLAKSATSSKFGS